MWPFARLLPCLHDFQAIRSHTAHTVCSLKMKPVADLPPVVSGGGSQSRTFISKKGDFVG